MQRMFLRRFFHLAAASLLICLNPVASAQPTGLVAPAFTNWRREQPANTWCLRLASTPSPCISRASLRRNLRRRLRWSGGGP